MRVATVTLRDFRTYTSATVELGDGLTVITGPNGAGKTNLLEAIYFGCTGRSCRTANDRELVRFDAPAARVALETSGDGFRHELTVGLVPGEPKRMAVDGVAVDRLLDSPARPLVSVFLPDRLDLVKGVPAGRRAHLDQFVAALWPARTVTRRNYAQTLAQRNALLGRIRSGTSRQDALDAWDDRLSELGAALMRDRREAVETVDGHFIRLASELGLPGDARFEYRPRSSATAATDLRAQLAERRQSDLDRGFTGHGPHRDDTRISRDGRDLRTYGSQGQQRVALLTLLLAERQAIADRREAVPVMLLDDVMSELDDDRREALVAVLVGHPGQSVITTTDAGHVPGAAGGRAAADVTWLSVREGAVEAAAPTAVV